MKKSVVFLVVLCSVMMLQPTKAANGLVYTEDGTEQLLAYEANSDGWECLETYGYAYNKNGEFICRIQIARKYVNGQWYYKVRPHGVGSWSSAQKGNYVCGNRKCSYSFTNEHGGEYYFNI